MRVSVTDIPSSFLPFVEVSCLSDNAIRLGAWPQDVYGGRWLTFFVWEAARPNEPLWEDAGEAIQLEHLPTVGI